MKLAKKMLACVMALALVGCFAVTAFAADKVTATVTAGEAVVGEEVVVTINLTGAKGLASAEMYLGFNPEVLEFVKGSADAASGGLAAVALKSGKTDTVSVGFMHQEAVEVDSFAVTVTFKVLKVGELKLTLSDFKAEVADGTSLTTDAVNNAATATAKEAAAATTEVTTAAGTTTATTTTSVASSTTGIPKTSDAGSASLAVAAGLVVLAGAAFVVSKKRK